MERRNVNEVLDNQKRCRPREYDREILEIVYKTKHGIQLSAREKEISEAYFKRR